VRDHSDHDVASRARRTTDNAMLPVSFGVNEIQVL
jgi:hypothetical protein